MSPLTFLGELVMLWLGFFCKIAAVIFPLFGVLHVVFIVFNDKFLSDHIALTLFLTVLFSFTCSLLTLSKICVLRRKAYAADKGIDQLWDADLTLKNETEEVPHYKLSYHYKDIGSTLTNLFFRNPYAFCKFRPAYGMFLITGFASLLAFTAALRWGEGNTKNDFYGVAVELIIPTVILIFVVYLLANSGFYIARKDYDVYTPFEEFVQVPMKNVIGKTVAIFLTSGGTYWVLVLFLLSVAALSIVSSNYLYRETIIDDTLKSLLPPILPDPRKVLRTVLILTSVVFVNALVGMLVSAYTEARKCILGIIEKNFQRNLKAIAFLLEDAEFETLRDLKAALDRKSIQPLTQNEVKAFNYICWPIWQTKAPFMLQKFERDYPDSDTSDEEHAKDEPENTEQLDAAVKPEQKDSKDVDQPKLPAVHEMLSSAESSTSPKYVESRLDKPSTSSANF